MMKPPRLLLRSLIVVAVLTPLTLAADWPQWRGPKQDNISTEKGLLKEWPKAGPKLLWTLKTAGEGYSCPVIVGGRLYITGARGDSEYVIAFDLKQMDGGAPKELWAAKIGPKFEGTAWNAGPIATPTVEGGHVYALGGAGDLVCVSTDGKEVWRKGLLKDLDGEIDPAEGTRGMLNWGYSGSPFVDGDRLICVPGGAQGTLAALDRKTGSVAWRSKGLMDGATYSSPVAVEVGGVRQYVVMTSKGAAGVAARDGALLWYYQRKPAYSAAVIPTPAFLDGHVFLTVGRGGFSAGCDLVLLTAGKDGFKAERVYGNRNMVNELGGVVLVGGHVYGYSDKRGWTCLDFKTGNVVWSERNALGAGPLTCAEGHLYCLDQNDGTVVLAEAGPAGWKEKGRFKLPQESKLRKKAGMVWTPPVIADGKLFLRDQELLFCYDVKGK